MADRIQTEREFHNARFGQADDPRKFLDKWYDAVSEGNERQRQLLDRLCHDSIVLEYGCADGTLSLVERRFARIAASYFGIDISDQAIERARARAVELNLSHCRFETMDAERMAFEDGKFDVVFGQGIIHHLDLDRAFSEVSRVLKPRGKAVFYEPMGHNPVINRFRAATPQHRTPDEHPIRVDDLKLAERFFETVEVQYFGLTTLMAVPFRQSILGPSMMTALRRLDRALLGRRMIGPYAWYALITLTR